MTPDPARHLLLTGFEPFDGDPVNPSGEVAKHLDGRVIGDSGAITRVGMPSAVRARWVSA